MNESEDWKIFEKMLKEEGASPRVRKILAKIFHSQRDLTDNINELVEEFRTTGDASAAHAVRWAIGTTLGSAISHVSPEARRDFVERVLLLVQFGEAQLGEVNYIG